MSPRASAPRHFGQRLHQALDRTAILPGRQRTTALANHYAVARETARLWLAGRAMPDIHRLVEIADDCRVSLDWLATGRGPMVMPPGVGEQAHGYDVLSADEKALLQAARRLSPRRRQGLLALLDVRD